MRLNRRRFVAGAAATVAAPSLVRAQGTGPIRIGEINSYTAQPAFLRPYRNGWELAVEQANAAAAHSAARSRRCSATTAASRRMRCASRATSSTPRRWTCCPGGFLSNVGLAIADFANQNKRLYVASEPLSDALVWGKGNRYTFRLRPSTYMQAAMLVEEAAKLPAKRWVTVAPNYEYGSPP